MITSCAEDGFEPGSKAEFWYKRASEAHTTFSGDRKKFITQASLWLADEDLNYAKVAWDLVEMEYENDAS